RGWRRLGGGAPPDREAEPARAATSLLPLSPPQLRSDGGYGDSWRSANQRLNESIHRLFVRPPVWDLGGTQLSNFLPTGLRLSGRRSKRRPTPTPLLNGSWSTRSANYRLCSSRSASTWRASKHSSAILRAAREWAT